MEKKIWQAGPKMRSGTRQLPNTGSVEEGNKIFYK